MNLPRFALIFCGAAFVMFGVLFLFAPAWSGSFVDLVLPNATARIEVRALYGGLEIGAGVFLFLCAQREAWQEPGLAATALMLGTAGICRMVAMIIDSPVAPIHYVLLASELGGAALAIAGLIGGLGIVRATPIRY